ncbi:MAG: hypothetical protein AABY45_04410 [Deltaproteobacteria bacterium]
MRICITVKESHERSLRIGAAYRRYLGEQALAESRMRARAPETISAKASATVLQPSGAMSFLARVCGSMPLPCQAVVLGLSVCASDDGNDFRVKRVVKPALPCAYKDTQRPLRSGFEMLKATLNLARGNIEEQSGPAPRMQPRRKDNDVHGIMNDGRSACV